MIFHLPITWHKMSLGVKKLKLIKKPGKGIKLWCDIRVHQKNKLIYKVRAIFGFMVNMENTIAIYSYSTPWALFPQKWCVALEFFVFVSSHCSTQIRRMRYGGSWATFRIVLLGEYVFKGFFFKLLNNDDKKKMLTKFYSKLFSCLGTGWENKI